MDFIQLNSFVTVIECGSFAQAAKKLHMAHSTITGHVQRLEQEMDCTLIRRSTRTMAVTDKGQVVYRFAKQFLGSQAEMIAELKKLETSHRINLAVTSCISFGLMPGILSKYRRKKNDVVFNVLQAQDKEVHMMLGSGMVSVGFTRKPCEEKEMECVLLGMSRYKLLVPNESRFSGISDEGEDPADLVKEYPLVLAAKGEDSRTRIEGRWIRRFGSSVPVPAPAVETSGFENIINCVRAGLGWSIVPNYVAQRISQDGSIRILEIRKETLKPAQIYMVYRKNESNQGVLEFIQFIRKYAESCKNVEDNILYIK